MFFKQLSTRDASLSYLLGCAGLGKAVAVDVVAGDEDWFVEQAQQADARITHVIDTHVHADHLSGGRSLARSVGASYCLHEEARGFVHFDFEALQNDQLIDIGLSRAAFVEQLCAEIPPRPADMQRIVAANVAA